ncbi:site-specific integrase [Antarcticibacterium flavum]|uniref:Site-specific integrase n=1 Tax=Antarcticibacterium flavum TaxID=2058175 RepID=A0A5B7WYS4_9FLAO|nr:MULTISPECIES: site-specific integrase [Antarcticibacterium]MCM4161719.1 integrase [Antarcticibacterium sp. W02-3]QCY68364.1 site-specific integrase [Antarcticibacterium flavum]
MANVTLRSKPLKGGMLSLYLDYYPPVIIPKTGKLSRREFLKLKIYEFPENAKEERFNESQLEIAEEIRATRFLQLKNKEFGLVDNIVMDIKFSQYFQEVVDEYYNTGSKGNYHSWKSSLTYWKAFMGEDLTTQSLTEWHVNHYRNFLLTTKNLRTNKKKLSINTASTYYKNFIMVLKRAYKDKLLSKNLAENARYIREQETHREYLSEKELSKLWKTPIDNEKVKHMAVFSALTGLRFSDVINLKWEDVYEDSHQGYYIQFREQKTGNIKNHPISRSAVNILSEQKTKEGQIFTDIKYSQISRPLKKWLLEAGIHKKITFHNFRHSYATLQLANGTDIYTVSKLLGHKNVSTTQIYTKVMDQNKVKAANRINLDLDGL